MYKRERNWLYDDGKEQQVAGNELTAEGVRRMSEWKLRAEGTRGRRTAVALCGGCLSRMIAARDVPMTHEWMKRKRTIALNKRKKEEANRKAGVVEAQRGKKVLPCHGLLELTHTARN
jgi:hypothetical protein